MTTNLHSYVLPNSDLVEAEASQKPDAVSVSDSASTLTEPSQTIEQQRLVASEQAAEPTQAKSFLPSGFILQENGTRPGLYHEEIWIGPLLRVLAMTRDENGGSWGLLLEWFDPDGRRHAWSMPLSVLAGRDSTIWLSRLADEGWSCAPGIEASRLLLLYLKTYRTELRALCVSRTGWHRGAFVLPDVVLGAPQDELIVLQTQSPHNPFKTGGTIEAWQSTLGRRAQGNSRLMFAICASLAAPLLEVTGQESGGFNFIGGSSIGKTTALIVAGSVWGNGSPSGGYLHSWRTTSNGLEGLAALHSDTALCLDEISQAPGRTVSDAAYMLTNGIGRARARQDGSVRPSQSWRVMFISTGEVGLAEKMREENLRLQAGQTVRLVDIPADAGAGMGLFEDLHGHASARAFADALKQAASINYGYLSRTFIQHLIDDRATVASLLTDIDQNLTLFCPSNVDSQVLRVAKRFLLCAQAGELAIAWGLLPWQAGEALNAAKACFDSWLARRGGTGAHEDDTILAQVRLFIEQHGSSRFQSVRQPDAHCNNRVGFRETKDGKTFYYILPETFKSEVCRGFDHRRVAAVLKAHGMLKAEPGRFQSRPSSDLPEVGRKRCYVLVFDEDAENENA